MKITDLLKPVSIKLDVAPPKSKEEAINILADLMEKSGNLSDKKAYVQAVLDREATGSTGLGEGIATPHAKSSGVKKKLQPLHRQKKKPQLLQKKVLKYLL